MTFGQPQFLWALLLFPLSLLFLLWARNRRREAMARLGNPTLVARLSAMVNRNGRRRGIGLWLIALLLLIFALARPQWGNEVQVVQQEGVQIIVVLDVSKSMLAQDIKPDRLTRAKLEISDLMSRLQGDEVGLVLFSGASFIQFPLTSDYDTALAFLNNASPDVISRPGTALGDAIRTAMGGFDPQRASQKVIVIMTDGENHEPDVLPIAEQVAAEDVIIYALGFGTPQGEPIPEYSPDGQIVGYKEDENGQVVLSKLDEVTLQQVTLATGGRYFRAQADGSELDQLVSELDNLQKEQLESRFETRRIERYQLFLLIAFVALFIHELIPERKSVRKGWALRRWRLLLPGRRPDTAEIKA